MADCNNSLVSVWRERAVSDVYEAVLTLSYIPEHKYIVAHEQTVSVAMPHAPVSVSTKKSFQFEKTLFLLVIVTAKPIESGFSVLEPAGMQEMLSSVLSRWSH